MACRLVALEKRPGEHLVGKVETLCNAITKIIMRAAGDQAKIVCGSFQLCAGIEVGKEGETHTVVQRQWEIIVLVSREKYKK